MRSASLRTPAAARNCYFQRLTARLNELVPSYKALASLHSRMSFSATCQVPRLRRETPLRSEGQSYSPTRSKPQGAQAFRVFCEGWVFCNARKSTRIRGQTEAGQSKLLFQYLKY